MSDRVARDIELLDALDARARVGINAEVWRIVREGRDVLQGHPAGARWDPGAFDVLYTSFSAEGALEEIHFHLSRQPVFPSKVRFVLHKIAVRTDSTLELPDMRVLEALKVSTDTFSTMDYSKTQEIGDAAWFLGFDGLRVPSARWPCQNLVLFTDRLSLDDLVVQESQVIDWEDWRRKRKALRDQIKE